MKLHLPLGLLAALVATFGALTPHAESAQILTRNFYTNDSWEPGLLGVYNLNLGDNAILGNDWSIHFTGTRRGDLLIVATGHNGANFTYTAGMPIVYPEESFDTKNFAFMISPDGRFLRVNLRDDSPQHAHIRATEMQAQEKEKDRFTNAHIEFRFSDEGLGYYLNNERLLFISGGLLSNPPDGQRNFYTDYTQPIQWLSVYIGGRNELGDCYIDNVLEMDETNLYTWTGNGVTTMGANSGDMYKNYNTSTRSDAVATMVTQAGFSTTAFSNNKPANGSYGRLKFVPAGEYFVGADVTNNRDQDIRSISVGEGVNLTTSTSMGRTFYLGGLLVMEGATNYSLSSQRGSDSALVLGSHRPGSTTVEFTINETFSLGTAASPWGSIELDEAVTALDIEVASGKKFDLYASTANGAQLFTPANGSLTLSGGGSLVLHSTAFDLSGATITLTEASIFDLGGNTLGDAVMTINNGSLKNAANYAGTVSIDADATCGVIDMGGVSAEKITSIKSTASSTSLKNIGTGTLTFSGNEPDVLHIGQKNLTDEKKGSGTWLLHFSKPEDSMLTFEPNAQVSLVMDDDLKYDLNGSYEGRRYLWFSNADFDFDGENVDPTDFHQLQGWFDSHFSIDPGTEVTFLSELEPNGTSGKFLFVLSASHIWYTSRHGEEVSIIDRFDDPARWQQMVVDTKLDLDLTPTATSDTIYLRYLSSRGKDSSDGGKLVITRVDPDSSNRELHVNLSNEATLNGTAQVNPDSVFKKDIVVVDDAGLTILEKTGEGTLTIEGNLTSNGTLEVHAGTLAIDGDDSSVGALSKINGTLSVGGTLTVTGDTDVRNGNNQFVESPSSGYIVGDGTLVVQADFQAGSRLSMDNTLTLQVDEDGKLHLDDDTPTHLGAFAGDGVVDLGGADVYISGKQAEFSGTLVSDIGASANIHISHEGTHQILRTDGVSWDLNVEDGAQLTLIGTGATTKRAGTASYGDITISGADDFFDSKAGYLVISAPGAGEQYAAGTSVSVNNLSIGADSVIELRYNFRGATDEDLNTVGAVVNAVDKITIGRDALFVLNSVGSSFNLQKGEDLVNYTIMHAEEGIDGYYMSGESLNWDSEGIFMIFYRDISLTVEGNNVVLNARVQNENVFAPIAMDASAMAGANLLWAARLSKPMEDMNSLLYQIMDYTAREAIKGNPAEASRILSSVAGSTLPTLGTAQRDSLRSHLMRMRDHTGLMGLDTEYSYEELPYYHCWVEGTGHFAQLQHDNMLSGYKLNSWGGSLGVDIDVDNTTSVGLAVTALYGDLTAGSADHLTGDMDSVYLSFIGKFAKNRWTHTVAASFGFNDFSTERTVDYGYGRSYKTQGSTSGWGVGAMYEITYDYELEAEGASILQPLLNLSVAKTSLRSFHESGPEDMSLDVGKQEWTSASVGVGARWLVALGENFFNRATQLELRANIAQDLGDTQGETSVALQANPGYSDKVKAAKAGATALQFGAGLRVPVSEKSTLHANANADIRSGMATWNLTAGYKFSF